LRNNTLSGVSFGKLQLGILGIVFTKLSVYYLRLHIHSRNSLNIEFVQTTTHQWTVVDNVTIHYNEEMGEGRLKSQLYIILPTVIGGGCICIVLAIVLVRRFRTKYRFRSESVELVEEAPVETVSE
jgi:hypothetical protein